MVYQLRVPADSLINFLRLRLLFKMEGLAVFALRTVSQPHLHNRLLSGI